MKRACRLLKEKVWFFPGLLILMAGMMFMRVQAAPEETPESEVVTVVPDSPEKPVRVEDKEGNVLETTKEEPFRITYGETCHVFLEAENGINIQAISKADSISVTEIQDSGKEGYREFVISAIKFTGNTDFVTFKKIAETEESNTDFYVEVERKTLTIDADHAQISYSKIYDGDVRVFQNTETEDIVTFKNLPLAEGIVTDDDVQVDMTTPECFQGNIDTKIPLDCGRYIQELDLLFTQSQLVLTGKDCGNYILEEKEIRVPCEITVRKRKVLMTVSDAEREYRHEEYTFNSDSWIHVQQQSAEERDSIEGIVSSDTGFRIPDSSRTLKEEQPEGNLAPPCENAYEEALSVDPAEFWPKSEQEKVNNYDFNIIKGNLTIKKEKIQNQNSAYLKLVNEESNPTMYIGDDKKIWVKAENGTLKLDANRDKHYNEVYLSAINGASVKPVNLTTEGYVFKEKTQGQEVRTLTLYLRNSIEKVESETFEYDIYLDGNAPVVSMENVSGETVSLDKLFNGITFGNYGKTKYKVKIKAADDSFASGLNWWNYAVLPLKQDIKNGEELQRYFDILKKEGKFSWEGEKLTAGVKEIEITRTDVKDENFTANNYVVLVQAYDNVNNSNIYTSMGIILDNNAPVVEIALAKGQEEKSIYNDSVRLQAVVSDNNNPGDKAISGIKRIYYQIASGEKNLDKAKEKTLYEREERKTYLLEELQTEAFTKDTEGNIFQVNKELNSNDIWVRVTAVDNSDNRYSDKMQLKIDITNPTVNVRYETKATEDYAPYYKETRTAVITVKERNINIDHRSKLYFDLKREKDSDFIRCNLASLKTEFKGIRVVSVKDSQQERESRQYTDDRTVEIRVDFESDDTYTFDVNCIDEAELADRENNMESFVIDKTVPELNVSYHAVEELETEVLKDKKQRAYSNKPITAKVEIHEHNFALADKDVAVDVQVKADKTGEKENIPDYHSGALKNNEKNWVQSLDTYTSIYTFASDGDYTYSITYTDLAGNKISWGPDCFTIDKTPPTARISAGIFGFWEKLLKKITFGLFSSSSVRVEITGDDCTSPIYPIQYARFHNSQTREELEAYEGWHLAADGNSGYTEFTVDSNEQFVVYAKVMDYAGNYEYFSSDGIIVDKTNPALAVSITNLSQSRNGIFNEDVTLKIDAEDSTAGDTYSGLEKVWYTVLAEGNVSKTETVELLNNSSRRLQGNKTFSGKITIPAKRYNSNDVKIQAFAQDFSGNQGHSEVTELKIDVTKPVISVAWNLNNPANSRYYKDTRTAIITVTDRNFNPDDVKFGITNTEGETASAGSWSSSRDLGILDSAVSTCRVSFPSDGDYTFTFECTDLAGNNSEYAETEVFTIDKTKPVVEVSYDNNSAGNGKYFKEVRTATVRIREHNFCTEDVRETITASLQGKEISAPIVSRFSDRGDIHTATVYFTEDGDYTFDIDCVDMAGNPAAEYAQDNFIIDKTAPEIEILDIQDKSANNDVAAPRVKATDINYDAKNVTIKVIGKNNGNVDMDQSVKPIENGQDIKLKDFARNEKMDDLYELTAKAVDQAGNKAEKSVTFSVNRYGSVYVLDKDTKSWLSTVKDKHTYMKQEKEVGVIEYNVDTIQNSEIIVNKDGELIKLKEEKDYTVTGSETDTHWKENYYKIHADNFADEGNYTVILSTKDKANNSMNNTSVKINNRKLPIQFTVDKTAPAIVVSGVEDNMQYRSAERIMSVDVKDNLALAKVVICADGKENIYGPEKLRETDGVIKTKIFSADNWQEIHITALDAAGNLQHTVLRTLVTPNLIIQYYRNKALFWSSITGISGMAVIITFLILKKRKKKATKGN